MARIDPSDRVPADLLEQALAETGVSAAKLAKELNVDKGTVSDWRRGVNPIASSRWRAIVSVLKELAPTWTPPTWKPGDPAPAPEPKT